MLSHCTAERLIRGNITIATTVAVVTMATMIAAVTIATMVVAEVDELGFP